MSITVTMGWGYWYVNWCYITKARWYYNSIVYAIGSANNNVDRWDYISFCNKSAKFTIAIIIYGEVNLTMIFIITSYAQNIILTYSCPEYNL